MKKVYAPGCWDLLHVGHVRFLNKAAESGELFVGVPSDEVVSLDKGSPPIIPCEQRMEMLRALECVSDVFRYDVLDFLQHLYVLSPDVLAVGQYWGTERRHRKAEAYMEGIGGKVLVIPYCDETSTTEICLKIRGSQ